MDFSSFGVSARRPSSSLEVKRRWALHALLLLRYRVREGMDLRSCFPHTFSKCGLPLDKTPPKGYSVDRIGQGAYGSSPNTATLFDVPT